MKKVLLTILWMLAILMPSATWAQSSEAYAVLSESNTKLTFYYDENKASRSGMSVGPFTVSWNVDGTQSVTGREWESAISTITTVVFDDSFANCTTLTSIAGWFNDNRALVDIQGIENLKTDNVTDMSGVFYMCLSLTSLDLSSFKTDNVTNMAGMFPGCSGLTSLNISSFNTENVVYIGGMFYNCSSLTSLDVSGFKTANVTDMSNLFYGCSNLSSLDLRNFNTANATNMSNMFSGCSHLETIYVGGEWTTAAVTEGSSMFSGCDNLVGGEGTTYSSSHIDYTYAHIDGGTSNPGYFTDIADYGKVKEAYAVLSDENTKLTFYYDKKKTDRSGMDIGPFAFASDRGWNDYVETITTVVFNESFANCTTITSLERWFDHCSNLTLITGMSNLKTDNVTDMWALFEGCSSLTSIDLTHFNTENVTNMGYMFGGCSSLTSLDVSGFNTDNVTSMSLMFYGCSGLSDLNVSGFNTANVTNMNGMFRDCSGLSVLDLSNFNTANVTDMSQLFYGCSGLSNLNVTSFNTANVTTMKRMFDSCVSLTTLDLSSFKTDKVTDMDQMFNYCSNLTTIYVSSEWSTEALTHGSSVFANCSKLEGGSGTKYEYAAWDYTYAHIDGGTDNPGYLTDIADMGKVNEAYAVLSDENTVLTFYYDKKKSDRGGMELNPFSSEQSSPWYNQRESITTVVFDESIANCTTLTSTAWWFWHCSNLSTITGMSYLKTNSVTNMEAMFEGCSSLTSLDVSSFNTSNVTKMVNMFRECSALTSLDLSNFNTENVTEMQWMFYNSTSLTTVDVSHFNTGKVKDMGAMFSHCSGLTSLDVSNFNTSSATTLTGMFEYCSSLTSLDVSHFNTAKNTDMGNMFRNCSSLTSLDLSNFDTNQAVKMHHLFSGCSNLTTVYVGSDWTIANVLDSGESMFAGCSSIEGGEGTTFDADHIDYTYAHIDGGPVNPGYFTDIADYGKVNEPYAVLSDENTKLTFYYDKKKSDRNGMGMGNYDGALVTVVTIDSSFANYYPESTSKWFEGFSMLTTINNIENLKTDSVTTMEGMFMGCYGLTSLDLSSFNTSNVTNMNSMFYWCTNLTSLDVSGFNTSNVTDMYSMFLGCSGLTSLDVSGFNTQKVMNMSQMFNGCSNLTSLDVSSFNMVNVTDMSNMFGYCSGLTSLDVSGFKTDNVTDMNQVFSGCSGLTSLNLTGLNTSNVTDMSDMFSGCSGLTSLDISGFNTVNVTNMNSMFRYCSSLTSLDVSGFNTANVTDMSVMFADCPGLTTIYAGGEWSTAMLSAGGGTFSNCSNLVGGEGTTYSLAHVNSDYARIDGGPENPGYFTDIADYGKVNEPYAVLSDENTKLTFYYDKKKTDRNGMDVGPFVASLGRAWNDNSSSITTVIFDSTFANDTTLTSTASWFSNFDNLTTITGIENLNTANVTDMSFMFDGCSSLTSLDVSGFNTSSVTDMSCMVRNCSGLTTLDLSGFNTVNVINMNSMFYGCSGLTSLALSGFNTANLMDMNYMFYGCSGLTSLDVSNFNTANVSSMLYVFWGCAGLTSLDLSSFNTANVMDMRYMFYGCSGLTSLDLSKFNTANVTNMMNMFEGCSSLATIYVGDEWRTTAVAAGAFMFAECSSLVGGEGTVYDADWQDVSYAHIDGGTSNPGYLTDIADYGKVDEPYAVLTGDTISGTTLTFYYDKHKETRGGLSVGPFENAESRGWNDNVSSITSVVFDDSFANDTTLTSTAWWFNGMKNLTNITGILNLYTANVTDMESMFYNCSSLTYIYLAGFNTQNVKNMRNMFSFCSGLMSLDVTGFNTQNVTDMTEMFIGCYGLTSLDLSSFNTANVTNMYGMFSNCTSLTSLDLSGFNTANVANMSSMFEYCRTLKNLNLSGFKTENVWSMMYMFVGCLGLTSLDLSDFNTTNVTMMYGMFSGCSGLTSLDLSSFNTANVMYMSEMFNGCSGLTSLDLSGFNTTNLATTVMMFNGCSNLGTIYAGGEWTTAAVTESNNMFTGCTNLVGGEGTAYDSLYVDATYAHIDGGISNPGYFTALGDTIVYAVQVTAGGSGAVTANGQTARDDSFILNVKKGRSLTLTFTPDEHYGVDNLTVNGTDCRFSIVNNQFVLDAVNEPTTVNVHFAPAHVVTIIASGNGRISPRIGNTTLDFEIREETYQLEVVEGDSASIFVRADGDHRIEHVWYNDTLDIRLGGEHGMTWNGYGDMAYTNVFDAFYWEGHVTTDTKFAVQFKHMPVVHTLLLTASKHGTVRLENREVTYELTDGQREYNIDEYDSLVVTLIPDENCSLTSLTLADSTNLDSPVDITSQVVAQSDGTLRYVIPSMTDFRAMTAIFANDIPGQYAVLADNTLTFYYDKKKDERNGMDVGPFRRVEERGWNDNASSITSVVFDSSFANDTTLTSTAYWFSGCSNLTTITGIENLKTDNVTSLTWMFQGCSRLTSLDVSGFKTDNVTDMATMFSECSSLTSLDVSGFKTENVRYMGSMFTDCSSLTSLDVSGFKTDNVTDMGGMFTGCSGLASLDVSSFNTAKVTYMRQMFGGCSGLTILDLSNFNTSNVTDMGGMFLACSALNTVYVGDGWSTAKVEDGGDMFEGCTSLVGDQGTAYDAGHTDVSYAHWDGGTSNPGYLSRALQMGDANGDGSVNIADAVATVTHILGETGEGYFYTSRADMNSDSVIDIFDVTLIVNAVFDATTPDSAITRSGIEAVPAEAIRLAADANDIYMDVDQAQQYTAFQFDMSLPEGLSLVGVKLASGRTDHQVSFVQRGDNQYRVVGLSMSNEALSSADGHLIELQVSDAANEGRVKISNVLFVTPAGKTVTGIDELLNTTMATDGNIYNLKGEKLGKSMQQLGKGVYIMNHKKVIIK